VNQSPESYLKSKGIKYKRTGPDNVRFNCPCCGEKGGFDLNLNNGLWRCKRAGCGEKGNLYQLKAKLGDAVEVKSAVGTEEQQARMFKVFDTPLDRMIHSLWNQTHGDEARKYLLEKRKLHHRILRMARVGWAPRPMTARKKEIQGNGMIAIPYFESPSSKAPYNGKLRWVPPEPTNDGKVERYRKFRTGKLGLYAPLGLDFSVPIVLVAGEIDTLSLAQLGLSLDGFKEAPCKALGFCPVGVPNGEGGVSDAQALQLAGAEDIVVAFDSDSAGHRGAQTVASKLGAWRSRIAPQWPGQDPNACLQAGTLTLGVVKDIILKAKNKAAGAIHTAPSRSKAIARAAMSPAAAGWSTGLPKIDKLIGMMRPWEINVLTAHTGAGKTTIGLQILVHCATVLKLKVLICAFEGGSDAALLRMARIHDGIPIPMYDKGDTKEQIKEKIDEIDSRIVALGPNVYALDRTGAIEPDAWKETLRYCLSRLGVQIVMIDLLNSMVTPGRDMWHTQDKIIKDTQSLIADRSIGAAHCIMVAHPATNTNKGVNRDDYILSMADLKGHSDLSQACQGVIQVYRPRNEDRTDILDSRGFSLAAFISMKHGRNSRGDEGRVELWLNKETQNYTDIEGEKEKGHGGNKRKKNTQLKL